MFLLIVMFFIISLMTYYNDLIPYTILFGTLTFLSFIVLIYMVFYKKDNKSEYNRKLKKILKVYNSKLVKINDDYELVNENIVSAKNIEDVFDLSDEFDKPIIYLNEENACVFILQYGNDILYYVLKENEKIKTNFEKEMEEYKEKKKNNEKELLSNINKTTIIQLKNNKFYKIKPVKK